MKVITDRGADLTPDQLEGLDIFFTPLTINLDGKTYQSGIDIQPAEFYDLLESAHGMPTTSLPSAGEFAAIYREVALSDPDILSVHISSGLSGTYNTAKIGAEMVEGANITVIDTRTLSAAEGWQVEAAAKAVKAGWEKSRIVTTLAAISQITETIYTLPDLKYLIHGGRISHISGLIAQALNIKPIIGVDLESGKYYQRGRVRTFNKAIDHILDLVARQYPKGTRMRTQVMQTGDMDSANRLMDLFDRFYACTWLPIGDVAPVLGAHTGRGLVGIAYAPLDAYPQVP